MRYFNDNNQLKKSWLYDFTDKEKSLQYYVDYFMARTNTMFSYDGLPDTIPANFLEMYYQYNGSCVISEYDGKLYAFCGSIGGAPNVYYFPENYVIANPALNYSATLKIGEDCILLRNDSMLVGLMPLVCKYATLLLENDITMLTANINKRIPVLAAVHDDNSKNGLDLFMANVAKGKLSIGVQDDFSESLRTMPYSAQETTRITDFVEYHQYIKASFFNEIGVRMSYNMKREAITDSEISSGDDFVASLALDMLDCRKKDFEKVNEKYGTNIKVDFSNTWKQFSEVKDMEDDLIKSEIESNIKVGDEKVESDVEES